MINIMWVIIPWVVIIIFAAGWYFGGKMSIKNERTRRFQEEAIHNVAQTLDRSISELYKSTDRLEEKIERMFAVKTKEEN